MYIKDPAVSQKHGAITWNGERWQIVDLGSSNGTTVNDAELEEDGAPLSLSDGDVIMIGTDTTVKISITPAPSGSNACAKPQGCEEGGAHAQRTSCEGHQGEGGAEPAPNRRLNRRPNQSPRWSPSARRRR